MIESDQIVSVVRWFEKYRRKLLTIFLVPLAAVIICMVQAEPLTSLILGILPKTQLYFTSPLEGFMVKFSIAFAAGLILSLPVTLYLIASLFSSKLSAKSYRLIYFFLIPFALITFYSGLAFSLTFVVPSSLKFFLSFGAGFMNPLITGSSFFSFVLFMSLMLGGIFELPIIMMILAKTGLVSYKSLSKHRRTAIMIILVCLAVLTPTPDAFTLIMVAVPLILLYEASIWLVFFTQKNKKNPTISKYDGIQE